MQGVVNEIRAYIFRNRIPQKLLSEKTGISQSKISQSLNGARKLSADEFGKIAYALNVSADTFIKPLFQKEDE